MLVALWTFTVREQALAVLVVAWVRILKDRHLRRRALVLGICATSVLAAPSFEVWRRTLPDGDSPSFEVTPMLLAYAIPLTCFTAALYLLPVIIATARGPWTRRSALAAVAISAGALLVSARLESRVFLGNYFSAAGAYGGVAPLDRQVFPGWVWNVAVVAASVALGPAVVRLSSRRWVTERWMWVFLGLFAAGTAAQAFVGQILFARYLFPVLPILAVLMFQPSSDSDLRGREWFRAGAALAVCCAGIVALMLTANALAYDGARWKAASALVDRGVPPDQIDAGLEWVGFHSANVATPNRAGTARGPAYVTMMGATICITVTGTPRPQSPPTLRLTYRKYGVVGREAGLLAYQTGTCGR